MSPTSESPNEHLPIVQAMLPITTTAETMSSMPRHVPTNQSASTDISQTAVRNCGDTERFLQELIRNEDDDGTDTSSEGRNKTAIDVHWWKSKHRDNIERQWTDSNDKPPQLIRSAVRLLIEWDVSTEKAAIIAGSIVVEGEQNGISFPPSRAVVRLVQLLCTSKLRIVSTKEANKMSSDLLLGFARRICSSLGQQSPEKDAEGSRKLFGEGCRSFIALLRSIDPLVRSRPFLLPPLWRGLCDVAVSLSNAQNDKNSGADDSDKSHELELALSEASACLLSYMREGEAQARDGLVRDVVRLSQGGNEDATSAQQRQHQIKVFIFLAARLAVLLPLLGNQRHQSCQSDMHKLLDDATVMLSRLRGIADGISFLFRLRQSSSDSACNEYDAAFLQPLEHLGHKVDQCFMKIAVTASGPHRPALDALLRLQPLVNTNDTRDDSVILSRASLIIGKLLLLQSVLGKISSFAIIDASSDGKEKTDFDDDVSLSVCEEILFMTLPHCHAYLTSFPLSVDSKRNENRNTLPVTFWSAIGVIVDCMSVCSSQRNKDATVRIHRLLVRWLAPVDGRNDQSDEINGEMATHPISTEAVINVVWSYLLRLFALSSANDGCADGQAKHMLSLLSGLLFDQRTSAGHRRNISTIFSRILSEKTTTSTNDVNKITPSLSGGLHQKLQASACSVLCEELNSLLKIQASKQKVNRKRRRHEETSSAGRSAINLVAAGWSPQDARSIGCVIEKLIADGTTWSKLKGFLSKELQTFCSRVIYPDNKRGRRMWSKTSSVSIVLFSFIIGTLNNGRYSNQSVPTKDIEALFLERTGAKLCQLLDAIIACFRSELKHRLESTRNLEQLINVGSKCCGSNPDEFFTSAIRVLRVAMVRLGRSFPSPQLQGVGEVLMLYTHTFRYLREDAEGNLSSYVYSLVKEVVGLLSTVGCALRASCSEVVLQQIASTFHALFSQERWIIAAPLMSALEQFASTIPADHQGILPKCLPKESQLLLQCRLKGKVFEESRLQALPHTKCHVEVSRLEESDFLLCSYDVSNKRRRKIYADESDVMIAPGSKITTLESGGKISAILIIPPDGGLSAEEALAAIGTSSSKQSTSLQLKSVSRVILTDRDAGCRLKVQSSTS